MNTIELKHVTILAAGIFLLVSCKKNKPLMRDEEKPAIQKLFVPIKMESNDLTINFKYYDNSAFLSEVINSDGYSIKISYKDQQLLQCDKYDGSTLFNSIYYSKNPNKDLKVTFFDVEGIVLTPTGSLILKQNAQNQITSILASGKGPSYPFKESTWSYSSSGNLSDITVVRSSTNTTPITYTHDEKNGIFKNVKHAQLLFLEMGYSFFCADVNNRLSYTDKDAAIENTDFTYQYNDDSYPVQFTIAKSKQTFKVTYVELKQ